MTVRKRWPAFAIAISMLTLAATDVQAQVDSTRCIAPFRFFFGTQGVFPAHMFVKVGKSCTSGFNAGGRTTFNRLFLASTPSKGKVTLREGGYFTYQAPSQAGSDSFTLKVCGRDANIEGCADIQVRVEISAG